MLRADSLCTRVGGHGTGLNAPIELDLGAAGGIHGMSCWPAYGHGYDAGQGRHGVCTHQAVSAAPGHSYAVRQVPHCNHHGSIRAPAARRPRAPGSA